MANTLIELNDTPSDYSGKALTFLRVNANETGISFASAELDDLNDVQTSGHDIFDAIPTATKVLRPRPVARANG